MCDDRKNEFLTTAVTAARLAGKVILDNLGNISNRDIGLKQTSDFVTCRQGIGTDYHQYNKRKIS
jgi:hypothetical protein